MDFVVVWILMVCIGADWGFNLVFETSGGYFLIVRSWLELKVI